MRFMSESPDEWDNIPNSQEVRGESDHGEASDVGNSGTGSKKANGSKKAKTKRQAPANKKANSSKKADEKALCFVCPVRKIGKTRFCKAHKKTYDAIRYQADQAGERALFDKLMEDPEKARESIVEFERNNAGGRWRKRLIDWVQWKRTYGVTTSQTRREKQTLMDADDYMGYILGKRPHWTREEARKDWERVKAEARPEDCEGDGANKLVWISKAKSRFRDHTTFITGAVEEGSKAVKTPKPEDLEALRDFAHKSAASSSDSFFKGNVLGSGEVESSAAAAFLGEGPGQPPSEAEVGKGTTSKRRKVDMGTAPVDAHEKFKKELQSTAKNVGIAIEKAQAAIQSYSDLDLALRDTAMLAYHATLVKRLNQVQAWSTTGTYAPPTPGAPGTPASVMVAGSVPSSAQASPVRPMQSGSEAGSPSPSAAKSSVGGDASVEAEKAEKENGRLEVLTATSAAPSTPPKGEGLSAIASHPAMADSATKRSAHLRSLVSSDPVVTVQKPTTLLCEAELLAMIQDVLSVKEVGALNLMKSKWKEALAMSSQLRDSLLKACTRLASSISQKQRTKQKEAKKAVEDKEKREIDETKKRAAEAAKQVQEKAQELPHLLRDSVHPGDEAIWERLDVQQWPPDGMPAVDMDAPWLLCGVPEVERWRGNARVLLALSNFGGQYKKDTKKTEGRGQIPMFKADAKTETDEMFKVVVPLAGTTLLDVAKFERAATVAKNTWLYGNDPKEAFCSPNPFCTSMCKTLAAGETLFVLVDLLTYLEAKEKLGEKIDMSMQDMTNEIRNLSIPKVKELRAKGCRIVRAEQKPCEIMHIPSGWIALERTLKGSLLYGCRKSFVVGSERSLASYRAMIRLTEAGKKQVQNMECVKAEICQHLGVIEE